MNVMRARARWSAPIGALLLITSAAAAQNREVDHNFHGWLMYFGDHRIGDTKWGVHMEGQWRRAEGLAEWQQLLLRTGVHYQLHPRVRLTGGYGFIDSFVYGDYPTIQRQTPEHRIWEQAQIGYKTGKVGWSTRVRFENRFLGQRNPAQADVISYRYENRVRFSQRATIPVSKNYYIAAYNEIKLFVKPYVSNSPLDQNRAYAGVGRKFGRYLEFEAGYLNQALWQRNGRVLESNHTMMFGVTNRHPFGKR